MNELQLVDVLIELRDESIALGVNPFEDAVIRLLEKYNILFFGIRFNSINSKQLYHSLITNFNIDVTYEALNQAIPKICSTLDMKCDPVTIVADFNNGNYTVESYMITLH